MDSPDQNESHRKSRLAKILGSAFLFALVMGPGPGLYLINGYAKEGGSALGIPVLYAWCVFWLLIEAVIVMIASRTLWRSR